MVLPLGSNDCYQRTRGSVPAGTVTEQVGGGAGSLEVLPSPSPHTLGTRAVVAGGQEDLGFQRGCYGPLHGSLCQALKSSQDAERRALFLFQRVEVNLQLRLPG